jgi:hypothetical protein
MSDREKAGQEEGSSARIAEQVRSIMEAAEGTAAAMHAEAEKGAAEIRERAERALEDARAEARDRIAAETREKLREADKEAMRYRMEARRKVDEDVAERTRRISELSDGIVARAEPLMESLERAAELPAQLQELAAALADARELIEREAAAVGGPEAEPERAAEDQAQPREQRPRRFFRREAAAEEQPEETEPRPVPDNVRLVALQMKVSGSSREEVEEHLRKSFGLEDPASIVDDVFGKLSEAR